MIGPRLDAPDANQNHPGTWVSKSQTLHELAIGLASPFARTNVRQAA
jgi:hypothetical protein